MRTHQNRPGHSLIELLVVMAAFAIVLNFGAVLLIAAMRVDQLSSATVQRLTRHTQLADLFRDDVNQSIAVPDSHGEWKRSKTCLILKQPADRWVVYRFDRGMIEQLVNSPEGPSRRPIPLGNTETEVEFEVAGNVIILRTTESNKSLPGLTREIRAALGGDVK